MSRAARPRRGEIWFGDLDPIRGHEQAGRRPLLVVSTDAFNQSLSGLAVVLPLTTAHRGISMRILIDPPDGGVKERCFVMCDQIRTVSVDRLLNRWGRVSYHVLAQVEDRLKILLDL